MLWEAWTLSKTLRTRPSELYGIHDEFQAFCLDRAVTTFGLTLEAELDEAANKAKNDKDATRKRERVLAKWLRDSGDTVGRFKDPAARRAT